MPTRGPRRLERVRTTPRGAMGRPLKVAPATALVSPRWVAQAEISSYSAVRSIVAPTRSENLPSPACSRGVHEPPGPRLSRGRARARAVRLAPGLVLDALCSLPYKEAHRELDRVYLSRALQQAKGSAAACARRIKLARTSLRRRLEQYDIRYLDDMDEE